jgi:hypothetical protein
MSARIQRETIWTEYAIAKPTLRTNAIFENPVRFTSSKMLRPTTGIRVKIIVTAIKNAPMKLPPTMSATVCHF